MITISSPAIRLRQANAQPCFRPPTNDGSAAGQHDVAVVGDALGAQHPPGPQRGSAGCGRRRRCRPLAIDGAAPRMTTNMIACSLSLNSTMASGNQAIDGIVCRPVISEPTAARSERNRDTSRPTTEPMTTASEEAPGAAGAAWWPSPSRGRRSGGPPRGVEHGDRPGEDVLGLPAAPHDDLPDEQDEGDGGELRPGEPTRAAGQIVALGLAAGVSSASSPATCWSTARLGAQVAAVSATAMTGHLLAEPVGDLGGEGGDVGDPRCGGAARCRRRTPRPPGRAGSSAARCGRRGGPPRARCG